MRAGSARGDIASATALSQGIDELGTQAGRIGIASANAPYSSTNGEGVELGQRVAEHTDPARFVPLRGRRFVRDAAIAVL